MMTMNIYEWCIAVLKGRARNTRFVELYQLCTKHYKEREFGSEDELQDALKPYSEFFALEEFKYDYVTFEDDGQTDAPILELAKDVLRSHQNRYTLSVLCRKMNESGTVDGQLGESQLKELLLSRKCFVVEERSVTFFGLSPMGEESDIQPIQLGRPPKTEEEKQKAAEQKQQRKLAKEQKQLLRKEILEEERERKLKLKQKYAAQREERRVENVKMLTSHYQITPETTLQQLYENKLIRKVEYTKCDAWQLQTVGDVCYWVKENRLTENMDQHPKHMVERMLKIASFCTPEYVRLIPKVKFSGLRKARTE